MESFVECARLEDFGTSSLIAGNLQRAGVPPSDILLSCVCDSNVSVALILLPLPDFPFFLVVTSL